MADLLIRGMEMPVRCSDCWFMDGEDHWCCAMRGKPLASDYYYGIKDRPDWCPLVEIPDHGRLIDADELERKGADIFQDIVHYGYVEDTIGGFSREMIENADTIIPASKEGSERSLPNG